MKKEDIVQEFLDVLRDDPSLSAAVAAVKILSRYIESSEAGTLQELTRDIKEVTSILMKSNVAALSVESGCELFLRFITLTSLDYHEFDQCKQKLLERGKMFVEYASHSRDKIANECVSFLRDGAVVLTHSFSRGVLRLFEKAAEKNTRLTVYITQSQPDCAGERMCVRLRELGIHAEVILDAAIGFIMKKVNLVVVGAEGVARSGGIINKIGTYPMAVLAKTFHKPFYCVAESFKFLQLFPLSQDDIPKARRRVFVRSQASESGEEASKAQGTASQPAAAAAVEGAAATGAHCHCVNPLAANVTDYTPPEFIALLFTDLGVLTPSAVSDELIKLYT